MNLGLETWKLGLLWFLLSAITLLIVLRLTRHSAFIREKIKLPLLALFLLFTIYDVYYIIGRPMPAMVRQYYLAIVYLFVATLAIRLATAFFFDVFLVRKNYQVPRLLKEIATVLLFSLALVAIIQNTLNIQVTTLLATSAVITVVLGLALQETLGNLFAGLALHLDPAYRPGDWIRTGADFGKVEEVTWRATKLRTVNNDLIVIPNGMIAKDRLINHSYPRTPHAARVEVSVNHNTPPNKMTRVVREAMATIDNVSPQPPPDVRLNDFLDFRINYEIKFWLKDYGLIEPTIAAVRKSLWYHLRRNNIEIPFPIRNVYMHERTEQQERKEQHMRQISDTLADVYLFASLDEDERSVIVDHLQEMRFAEGELIIREGEMDDSFFVIEEGRVAVFITSPQGNKKVLTELAEGDFFGEMALLTGERRSASVVASTDVKVWQLDKESFKQVLERKPDILDEIGSVLSRRRDELSGLMAETSGEHDNGLEMNMQEAKSRILSRLRDYFGL